MNIGNNWKFFGAATIFISLGFVVSCTRTIAIPVSPSFPTNTPIVVGTPTNSPTTTPTNTPTNTVTPTITNTPNGPTNTPTNSPTVTPSNTPSNTATPSPTNTITSTPTANPNAIADFEAGLMKDNSTNGLSGVWYAVLDTTGSTTGVTAILAGGTGCSSGNYVSMGGNTAATGNIFAQLQGDFLSPAAQYNINTTAPGGTNAFVFCIKGSAPGNQVWFSVADAATSFTSADAGVNVPISAAWTSVTVCFNHMQSPNWAPASLTGHVFDPTTAIHFSWKVTAASSPYEIDIDNFQFAQVVGAVCPTLTPTATVNPMMIDDFETNTANLDPGPFATFNGSWFTTTDGSVAISPVTNAGSWTDSSPGQTGGAGDYAAHVTIAGAPVSFANFGFNFINPPTTTSTVDLSAYTGVIFYVKADAAYPNIGNYLKVSFPDADTALAAGICSMCSDFHSANVCLTTSWTPVTIFFSQLSQAGWGVPQVAFKPASIFGMQFEFPVGQNAGGMGVWVDDVQLTTAPAPAPLGANAISNFDFNNGGTGLNPNLTNYPPAGAKGFATYVQTTSTVFGVMMAPFILCGSGDASNFSAAVSCKWTDAADGTYPGAQLQLFLMPNPSGGVTNYYNLPSGLTGIQFAWNVLINSTTGTTSAGINLHYNNANIDATGAYGTCTTGCYDDYLAAIPKAAGGGWSNQSVPFTSFKQGYPSTTVPADACEPGGGASNAVFAYSGGCYNNTTIGFSWQAQSGNGAGSYTTYFEVDNVSFY